MKPYTAAEIEAAVAEGRERMRRIEAQASKACHNLANPTRIDIARRNLATRGVDTDGWADGDLLAWYWGTVADQSRRLHIEG